MVTNNESNRISTALLLAAGTGSRLQPLTVEAPKCLIEVNGITILERLLDSLQAWQFDRLVIVVGHLEQGVRDFIENLAHGLTIEYVRNPLYRTTNNIYSLWSARHAIEEPFLMLECDLVFDHILLDDMLEPDRIAVSRIEPWMNGTRVALDRSRHVTRFYMGKHEAPYELTHKTVNMYSFSRPSWRRVTRRLEQYISSGRVNEYYEAVFADMVADGVLSFEGVIFDERRWYEIDTLEDLRGAEELFRNRDVRQMVDVAGA